MAWPRIQSGEHVVLTAPTGSGKTMAAFLCALNTLISDNTLLGKTRVLYISPLKALNNDIQQNLLNPLKQLKTLYENQGECFPTINVMTRSGDTTQSDRRKMLRHPPEILITTPESLNLLLSTASGRILLGDLHTVILDEIHAVLAGKRGAHLMTAVERLPRICGELQRIALSATVNPIEIVAEFVGGFQLLDDKSHPPRYKKRDVKIIQATNSKLYSLKVISALNENKDHTKPNETDDKEDFWHPLIEKFSHIISSHQSTLLFVNSRRLCEKITMKVNQFCGERLAYSHHGSLSREIRTQVEHKLKKGDLKAIVATNSLELGIDIGSLDEVVLIQSPPSISASIQRLGRAGHGVGQISFGRLFPTHQEDFLHAAALSKAVHDQDIEPIKPIRNPLDVLAQIIISCCANETWDVDALYTHLCCSYTFRDLPRHHYDLIIQMLTGRYAGTRIRELKPRISLDALDNSITATKGAVLALYMSGGTIPNRGYYQLRDAHNNALIGELDEEFVWEASIGQIFTLGTQHWKVEKITHNDVFVSTGVPKNSAPPFWRAESGQRDFHFSCKVGELLAFADQLLQTNNKTDEQTLSNTLKQQHSMDEAATQTLIAYLKNQRQFTGVSLPHRHHIVVEHINSGPGGHAGYQLVIHTGWGAAINRPIALALEAAWELTFDNTVRLYADDNCMIIQLPQPCNASKVLSLVTEANLEALLKKRLEGSGFFAARFRECAGRALLLTKSKFNQRLPLWMSRLQAQKLHAAVDQFEDFPILLESWRSCLHDEFDLPHCHQLLTELACDQIQWSEVFSSTPSPFAHAVSWGQINQYMYMEDQTPDNANSNLREDLLKEVVHSPTQRPLINSETNQLFEAKRQRLFTAYCPTSYRELLDWVKERVILPIDEWEKLLTATVRDTNIPKSDWIDALSSRLCMLSITLDVNPTLMVVALEKLPSVLSGLYQVYITSDTQLEQILPDQITIKSLRTDLPLSQTDDDFILYDRLTQEPMTAEDSQWELTTILSQWLRFYGPLTVKNISQKLAIPINRFACVLDDLLENKTLISGHLLSNSEQQHICDAENFESLMRLQRASATPSFVALPHQALTLFIAEHQGLLNNESSIDDVYNSIEILRGLQQPASHWEQYILPARTAHYDPSWLDSLMQEGEFFWQGHGKQLISFWFNDEVGIWHYENHTPIAATITTATSIPTLISTSIPTSITTATTTHQTTDNQPLSNNQPSDYQPSENELSGNELLKAHILSVLQEHATGLDFTQLLEKLALMTDTVISSSSLTQALWSLVWSTVISNDSYSSLRKGILNQFKVDELKTVQKSRRHRSIRPSRSQLSKRQGSLPYIGRWFLIDQPIQHDDLLEQEENAKDRARILLSRYGIVCWALVKRESDQFSWREIFRALRLMELSGEVLVGQFFTEVPGPQFITHESFRRLQKPLPDKTAYWMNATDPASLCGISVDIIKSSLPQRRATTQLVYWGSELIIISERNGKSLRILIEANDTRLNECFEMFRVRLERQFNPEKRIIIETINDANANRSLYLDILRLHFDVLVDHKQTILQRRYC